MVKSSIFQVDGRMLAHFSWFSSFFQIIFDCQLERLAFPFRIPPPFFPTCPPTLPFSSGISVQTHHYLNDLNGRYHFVCFTSPFTDLEQVSHLSSLQPSTCSLRGHIPLSDLHTLSPNTHATFIGYHLCIHLQFSLVSHPPRDFKTQELH